MEKIENNIKSLALEKTIEENKKHKKMIDSLMSKTLRLEKEVLILTKAKSEKIREEQNYIFEIDSLRNEIGKYKKTNNRLKKENIKLYHFILELQEDINFLVDKLEEDYNYNYLDMIKTHDELKEIIERRLKEV